MNLGLITFLGLNYYKMRKIIGNKKDYDKKGG